LLRKKYGTSRINRYYNPSQEGRFLDFSILIDNLDNNRRDFAQYTSSFDNAFFDFIRNKIRKQANANAHSMHIIDDPNEIENIRNETDQYCRILCDVIRII
jgi:hypothetical protein